MPKRFSGFKIIYPQASIRFVFYDFLKFRKKKAARLKAAFKKFIGFFSN